jgi:hypothetical protein
VRAILETMGMPESAPVAEFLAFAGAGRASSESIVAELERHLVGLEID